MNLSPAAGCLTWGRYCSSDGFAGHGRLCAGLCICFLKYPGFFDVLIPSCEQRAASFFDTGKRKCSLTAARNQFGSTGLC